MATAPGGPRAAGWGRSGAGRAARALLALRQRAGGCRSRGLQARLRWPDGCARCVPSQAARAATPPWMGGAAAVLPGPAGQRFVGADLGRPGARHPRIPREDVKGARRHAACLAGMKFAKLLLFNHIAFLFGFPLEYGPHELA